MLVRSKLQYHLAGGIHGLDWFSGIAVTVFKGAFEQLKRFRPAGWRKREDDALAVFPAALFNKDEMILRPSNPVEANGQFQEFSRGAIKGSVEKEEGIADRDVFARIALVAGLDPKNGSRRITPPLLLTGAGFHS